VPLHPIICGGWALFFLTNARPLQDILPTCLELCMMVPTMMRSEVAESEAPMARMHAMSYTLAATAMAPIASPPQNLQRSI
jgi:hypothetical protein